jgi:hypothetical protein
LEAKWVGEWFAGAVQAEAKWFVVDFREVLILRCKLQLWKAVTGKCLQSWKSDPNL